MLLTCRFSFLKCCVDMVSLCPWHLLVCLNTHIYFLSADIGLNDGFVVFCRKLTL